MSRVEVSRIPFADEKGSLDRLQPIEDFLHFGFGRDDRAIFLHERQELFPRTRAEKLSEVSARFFKHFRLRVKNLKGSIDEEKCCNEYKPIHDLNWWVEMSSSIVSVLFCVTEKRLCMPLSFEGQALN